MNQFSFIDSVYTFLNQDPHGEIVTVSVEFSEFGWNVMTPENPCKVLSVWWKRKQSYVPASVNAFHMHRGLCKELRESPWFTKCTPTQQRSITKQMALCVSMAYIHNACTGSQAMRFVINAPARKKPLADVSFAYAFSQMLEAAEGYSPRKDLTFPVMLEQSVVTGWKSFVEWHLASFVPSADS